ncbi:MAG: hypothetical protein ACYSX0_16855 [Planctomycetota bacterium]|jgi:hypothetical protein
MHELIAVALLAGLFVLFGVFVKARRGCPGPDSCEEAERPEGCESCDLSPRETVESIDARVQ